MKPKKTWIQKLHTSHDLPKIITIQPEQEKRWGVGTCVVPAPLEVDRIMKEAGPGKLITINEIRRKLARKHGATTACPITTGIFSWIAAHAAAEEEKETHAITPYWRTLKRGGEINPKYPGGVEGIATLLRAEGHVVYQKGKRWLVQDYKKVLVEIET
ncbi:MAG: hypothetical protein ACO1QB_06910 [Verrucomicrobiales bacterium]